MKAEEIINALDLPPDALVHQRVPKKLLLENGAPTSADKRRINEGIEELRWIASLKPTTVGIADYRDASREYLEIAIVHMSLRDEAVVGRLTELVHRAIPYPVVLVAEIGESASMSLAHKRWSEGAAGKTVLDGELITADSNPADDPRLWTSYLEALSLRRQPRNDLNVLYQGWIDSLVALAAARITDSFVLPVSAEQAAARRTSLREYSRLETEIARLRAAAQSEIQLPRRVELNLEMKRRQAELTDSERDLRLEGHK
jgi:hypothetical protein